MSQSSSIPAPPEWSDFPGARAPDRRRTVSSSGIDLAVIEWGPPDGPPLLLAHGGADFARTFDVFAPLLAAHGYRVVAWDHRGHGDSARADLYSWLADVGDVLAVLDSVSEGEPVRAVGHSKGAGLFASLAAGLPERFSHYVNIDGVPSRRGFTAPSELDLETRVARRARWLEGYLESRAALAERRRRPGAPAELAERRARMNPRLSMEWLRYLVTVGARRSDDGWRWKLDIHVRMGSPGPWRPNWGLRGLSEIEVPMLAILGRQAEPMGWGTDPEEAREDLPRDAELEVFDDSGHFVHIEHPERTARRVLEFLQ